MMPEESRFKIFSSGRVFFNLPQRAGARACGTGWATDIEKQGEEKTTISPLIHTFSMISPCFFIYTRGRRKRMERGVDQDENHISEGC